MTKALTLHDFDTHYKSLQFKPVILNEVPAKTKEEREHLNSLIMTTYNNTDTLESIPSCSCGELSYNYNINQMCPKCGTRVELLFDKKIESTVWFKAPKGIKGLVNPMVWLMISELMRKEKKKNEFNVLLWFCNSYMDYPPSTNKGSLELIRKIETLNIPRGLNSFIENFDRLIPIIVKENNQAADRTAMLNFFEKYRDILFPMQLPIPSKIAFVLENTSTGKYADMAAIKDVVDACLTITSLDNETVASVRKLEGKMANVLDSLTRYYLHMFGDPFSAKEGWLRKTVYGTRMHFAYRSVITSQAGVHDYETIKLPYSIMATLLRPFILNRLRKRGMVEREAFAYSIKHVTQRDPLIVEILEELIADTPYSAGMWTFLIRYPSLARASNTAFRIIGFSESSIELSVLTTKGSNADFT
jgi:hypothetical protein